MGVASDPLAVVDPELRVFGIDGLRVVDGSVMPDLVGGNINAPIIMIAEKAADLIRGRAAARSGAARRRAACRTVAGASAPKNGAWLRKPRNGLHNPVTPAYKLRPSPHCGIESR